MTKIEEFEKKIIKNGMTENDYEEYKTLLKRVPGDFGKQQHCYTTAIQFPRGRYAEAVRLIEYGLDNYDGGWFPSYTSYLYIGKIYTRVGLYKDAYESYLIAMKQLDEHEAYGNSLSLEVLWSRLHLDAFCYSAEAEECYDSFMKTNEFQQEMINNKFKVLVAQIVIAKHKNDDNEVKSAYRQAREMLNRQYIGRLLYIFKQHNYTEELETTPEAINFIKRMRV